MLKVDRYYDVACDYCGKHLSTDYQCGMGETPNEARLWAKDVGFQTKYGKNICPECLQNKAYLLDEETIDYEGVVRPEKIVLTPAGMREAWDNENE